MSQNCRVSPSGSESVSAFGNFTYEPPFSESINYLNYIGIVASFGVRALCIRYVGFRLVLPRKIHLQLGQIEYQVCPHLMISK